MFGTHMEQVWLVPMKPWSSAERENKNIYHIN